MSSSEWVTKSIKKVAYINKNSIQKNYPNQFISYIDTASVTNNIFDAPQLVNFSEAPSRAKRIVSRGDTIISSVRPNLRHFGFVEDVAPNTIVSTGFVVLTPFGISPKYLYYLLTQDSVTDFLAAIAETSTTTFPAFRPEVLADYEITFPKSFEEQERLANILYCLEKKIELNRQMNATLEAMAQAIFKEWFVDFNYPGATGELIDSPLGPIPRGWEVCQLSVVVDIVDCLHTKKPDRQEINTGNILLQLENILDNGLIDLHKKYWITDVDYMLWTSRIEVKEGDIVITNVGRVGALARIPAGFLGALGRNMTSLRAKNNFLFTYFLILLLKSEQMRNEIDLKTDPGTILNSLNVKNIPLLRFIHPPAEIVIEFEQTIKYLWVHMDRNMQEIIQLETLRDLLLPKLMAGEIELS